MWKAPVPPHCERCGASQPIATTRSAESEFADMWLCGSCLYKREHPDAAPRVQLPRERRRPLPKQKTRLFDPSSTEPRGHDPRTSQIPF